jgi:hypothetical protein
MCGRPSSRHRRGSVDHEMSSEDITLTEEPEVRLPEDLATVPEVYGY